ncbi:MAG: AAA family ATPase [Spirochaetota bacterium]
MDERQELGRYMHIKTGKDLIQTQFTTNHLIQDFLPYGLTLLCGRPKIGKSTFLYNLSFDISENNYIFDYFPNEVKGNIFYISYEDSERKIQNIYNNLKYNTGLNRFYYSLDFPTMENEGIDNIENMITEYNLSVVIIDTLIKFAPTYKMSYNGSYQRLERLHAISNQNNISVIITHHTRKNTMLMEDEFDTILGSQGLRGLADTIIMVNNDYVVIEGREIEERLYKLNRKDQRFFIENYRQSNSEDDKYINFIHTQGKPTTLKELYDNFPDKKETTIRNRLAKLCTDGRLERVSKGLFEIGPYFDKF